MFGLEKFEYYLHGREVVVETDHSPLEQIFKKNIAEALARLQRFLLRCLNFDITVKYKPGKSIPVADALSRVCFKEEETVKHDSQFITTESCPIDINTVQEATIQDQDLNKLKDVIFKGWPAYRKQCPQELWDYWTFRCDLVIEDGLILKGDRIIIPEALRSKILDALHTGHQGETKCLLLARESVFWPGITNDIKQLVKDCDICNKFQPEQPKLPLMQPDLPTRPWEKLGTDIFEFKGLKYLMIVDYYSRFPVIRLLSDMSAETICNHFTSILAEYGLPSIIIADFGTHSSFRNSKIIVQRMESQLHSAHHTTTKQIVLLREQLGLANHCGRKMLKVASVHTQHCGCTELHHLTIICHHHMSYSMVTNLKL